MKTANEALKKIAEDKAKAKADAIAKEYADFLKVVKDSEDALADAAARLKSK